MQTKAGEMAGKLAEKLLPILRSRFPGRGLRVHDGKQPFASFPAAHPEVGDLRICDDDIELTLYVGELTHQHFSPFDYSEPADTREAKIVEEVAAHIEAVFGDEIEFWADERMGGSHARGTANATSLRDLFGRRNVRTYVWSGPLQGNV